MSKAPWSENDDKSLEDEFASERVDKHVQLIEDESASQRAAEQVQPSKVESAPKRADEQVQLSRVESIGLRVVERLDSIRGVVARYGALLLLVITGVVVVTVREGARPDPVTESTVTTAVPVAPAPETPEIAIASPTTFPVVPETPTRAADTRAPELPVSVGTPAAVAASKSSPTRAIEPTPSRVVAPAPPRVSAPTSSDVPPPRATNEPAPSLPTDVPPAAPAPPMPPAPAAALAATPVENTSPPSPPAAVSATAARSVSTPILDAEGAIQDVLGRYRSALGALDSKAVRQVWPTVNERSLERALGQLQEQDVSFFSCSIDVKGEAAQAVCVGTTSFIPKVGSRSPQSGPSQWNFGLRKDDGGAWQIQNVVAQ